MLMDMQTNTAVIIPSLNPDQKFLCLLDKLRQAGWVHIITVNDGSGPDYQPFFDAAAERFGCTVLVHAVNQGKGRALKTAFNYILASRPELKGAVTVDADGQHTPEDILKCAQALAEEPDKLILGCRDFSAENIPFRSRFGNIMTRGTMKALCGIKVSDTQTGLRGFSRPLMEKFMRIPGERFEYEMHMLIETKQLGVGIREVPIQTIYIEENASSHFNPLRDSIKIYSVFLKFILSSLSSFVVDIVLFAILTGLLRSIPYYIIISTVGARIVSAFVNFTINKKTVFKSDAPTASTLAKYFILCVVQMTLSALGVSYIYGLAFIQRMGISETVVKVVLDTILFLVSYSVQRSWVFKKKGA